MTIWHGSVTGVNGDELTVLLRREGSGLELMAEVSASRWALEEAGPGDLLVLDDDAVTVTRLSPGTWTQPEPGVISGRAREWHERLAQCTE